VPKASSRACAVLELLTVTLAFAICQTSFADEADMARGISDVELAELGTRWAEAMNSGDLAALTSLVDFRALGSRSADSFSANARERNEFVDGFVLGGSRTAQTWISDLQASQGRVDFLRVRELDGMRGPLIRLDMGERGFNYSLLIVAGGAGADPLVVDMFVALSGERLSDSLGAVSQLVFAPDSSVLGRLFGLTEVDPQLLRTIQEFSRLRVAGQNREAFAKLSELPEAVRNHRVMLNISLALASMFEPEIHRKEVERLALHHGDDPTAGFALIDYNVYEGNYATAISIVEGMELAFGADAALASLKADLALADGDASVAQQHARQSIKLEPDYENGYWSLLSCLLDSQQYAEAIVVLEDLERRFDYLFDASSFAGNEVFAGLVRSTEFSAWIDSRTGK
jgi:hypothetical protein